MKRQILCKNCALKNPMKVYDGEWQERFYGKARGNLLCDLCGKKILVLEHCAAESTGLNTQKYYRWEDQYIIKEGRDET